MHIETIFVLLSAVSVISQGNVERKQRMNLKGGIVFETAIFESEEKVINLPEQEDIFVINQKTHGLDLVDGDIAGKRKTRNTRIDRTLFWPTTTIPIQFDRNLSLIALSAIEDARQEYEMRTCFTFPYRTDETDFIVFKPLNGCWSYVGVQHGPQVISIGSGCEQQSVMQHEMMHAIGIEHEQSRTDRDDYVIVQTKNILEERLYDFTKYTYDVINDRRVPYDFHSVMHYGGTAFSKNKEKTIITRDARFQNVIGQRATFSDGDVLKMNRMYNCGDQVRVSYSCNFDDEAACGYVQDISDALYWYNVVLGDTDQTLLHSSFPNVDSTLGRKGQGSYMLLYRNSSNNSSSDTPSDKRKGSMVSMRLQSRFPKQCLEFWYYINTDYLSSSSLTMYLGRIDPLNGDVQSKEHLLTITGNHDNYWNLERRTLEAPAAYKLIVEANRTDALSNDDVIAIDDISILDKPCDDGYFVINNFVQFQYETISEFAILGPTMFSDAGYAFEVEVYPKGYNTSYGGEYISIYFRLVKGKNDDSLQWPFYNQIIRFTVVDQGAEAVSRMDTYKEYITSSAQGDEYWNKPIEVSNSWWGFQTFMKLDDIMHTRNFLKNDAIVISVRIRDMNNYVNEHKSAFATTTAAPTTTTTTQENTSKYTKQSFTGSPTVHYTEHKQSTPQLPNEPLHKQSIGLSAGGILGVAMAVALSIVFVLSVVTVCFKRWRKSTETGTNFSISRALPLFEQSRCNDDGLLTA